MQWPMKDRMTEQFLFYITLMTFFMMPYCLNALHNTKTKENKLLSFFTLRIRNAKYYNTMWMI